MCGISGFYLNIESAEHPAHRLSAGGFLHHRGPDDFASWNNDNLTVSLQHYRLSILDLSSAGAQPMRSLNGRFVITFNGEIYNHLQLRADMDKQGFRIGWRGHSDTETLLEAIALWGVEKTINKCVGMFAFGLYDLVEKKLILARDRLGEKPLYYAYIEGGFCFASELKVLKKISLSTSINSGVLASYMRLGYVTGPNSIYEGIYRMPSASILTIGLNDIKDRRLPSPKIFWKIENTFTQQNQKSSLISKDDVIGGLNFELTKSIKGQMISDVPMGVLLSGGIDSSLIAAIAQAISLNPIKTFTLGFDGNFSNEAPYAKSISEYLGTDHSEFNLKPESIPDLVRLLPSMYCEPFADSSQIPTFAISKFAREKVTVALSGEGGDELFGGYLRYFRVNEAQNSIGLIPRHARQFMRQALLKINPSLINLIFSAQNYKKDLQINWADRFYKMSNVLDFESPGVLNRELMTAWDPLEIMKDCHEADSIYSYDLPQGNTLIEKMMHADLMAYLPDDLMVKIDRASMAVGLECRAPFLDVNLVKYALNLSSNKKFPNLQPKGLLKNLLECYVPRELFDRPKQGFGLPLAEWIRGPLRSWVEDMLAPAMLSKHNYFNANVIQLCLKEHMNGSRNWEQKIWIVLMFQMWFESQSI